MRLPARHRAQLILLLHILEKGNHAPDLFGDGGLKSTGIILFDKTPQTFVDHVPDLHEGDYTEYRIASSDTIQIHAGTVAMPIPRVYPDLSSCYDHSGL